MRDRGFAVAMIDWRGQGHSCRQLRDGRKGYVRSFSDFEIDVETFVQQVVMPDCPPLYFALAHFDGRRGDAACGAFRQALVRSLVLSAPMIDPPGRSTSLPARLCCV